jgi:PAS domain S-box-containing protein
LHASDDAASLQDESTKWLNPASSNLSAISFGIVSVEDWQTAFQHIAEGKQNGRSFALIFLSVRRDQCHMVRENIEKIWELDDTVRCILCFKSDEASWATNLSLSRTEQWALFRFPGLPEELFQLASCLCAASVSSAQCASDEITSSDQKSQLAGEALPAVINNLTDQQTALASAQDELATSKVYVDNVLRSMADSLLVIDANLTIGSVNPSLLALLGYGEDELIGQSPGMIFGEEFAQGSIIENLLLQGSVSGVESSFLTNDGRLIPISVSGSMMQDEQGQFQGLVCVAQDITARKQMEEEKLELHEQLLDTSRQLGMAEVASDVLHNVGNALNSINVSIGVVTDLLKNSMVGDVGRISQLFHKHREDLGNYFSSNSKGKQIPAYLEKLAGQLVEEQRVAIAELARLRENAQNAQQCVAVQQDLAKPSGITEEISVIELVEEALTLNQELLENSKIAVSREFQEIPQLIVDKHQVLEVMVEVIRNACQAMVSVSTKQLIVRAKLIPGPPDSVCLEVQDSGIGIASDDLIKIFGQGYSTKNGKRGMSLHSGALMVKNLGGALRAHSEGIGHGATFSLELPGNFHFPDL